MDQAIVESQNRSRNRKVPASETGQSCNLDYFAKAEIPAGSNPCGFFTDDWITWEILDRFPDSDDDQRLARIIGGLIIHDFYDWWHAGSN